MKKLTFLLFLIISYSFANERPIQSKIAKVTVFLEGATIERESQVNLFPGENTLVFKNLSPDIVEQSIQIAGLGKASIVSLQFEINYMEKDTVSEKYSQLENKLRLLRFDKNTLESKLSGLNQELKLLSINQKVRTENTVISIDEMKQIANYYRTRVSTIEIEKFSISSQLEKIIEQLNDLKNEKRKLEDTRKEKRGEITLKLNTTNAQTTRLQLTYNIKVAGWFPSYDIRATEVGKPLEVTYKANVYQQSGTDWKDVALVLSTGDPHTNNQKPTIRPKYINFGFKRNSSYAPISSETYKYNPTIRSVSGSVTDETGLPIPNVTITEKGTNNSVKTSSDGTYTIKVNGGRELVYRTAFYFSKNLPIHSKSMIVQLEPDNHALNEVVVTEYAISQEKKALGYAISGRTDYDNDINSLLNGKVAGVQISGTGGAAGSGSNFIIRSKSAINGDNKPLFIVDGVPFDDRVQGRDGYAGGNTITSSRFLDLDPDNIENVQVLKGLSAATLYGQNGRNGVVLITTKDGKGIENSTGNFREEGITNTTFTIKNMHTIISNADMSIIEIDNFELDAKYDHYTTPELNENVFLTASTDAWEKHDILAGDATIYFRGSYSGNTHINPSITTDTLKVSLGIDPNVIVKRSKINNLKSKSFLGSNKMISQGFTIVAKNNKQSFINLTIEDRIPISQNKEIKVMDINSGDASYDEESGILVWKVSIAPNSSQERKFGYTVKYPRNKQIDL